MDFWDYLTKIIIWIYKYIFIPWEFDDTVALGTVFMVIGVVFLSVFAIALKVTKKTEDKLKFLHCVIYCAVIVLIPVLFIDLYWYSAILLSIPIMIIIDKTEIEALGKIFPNKSKKEISNSKISVIKKIFVAIIVTAVTITALHLLGCNYLLLPKNVSF